MHVGFMFLCSSMAGFRSIPSSSRIHLSCIQFRTSALQNEHFISSRNPTNTRANAFNTGNLLPTVFSLTQIHESCCCYVLRRNIVQPGAVVKKGSQSTLVIHHDGTFPFHARQQTNFQNLDDDVGRPSSSTSPASPKEIRGGNPSSPNDDAAGHDAFRRDDDHEDADHDSLDRDAAGHDASRRHDAFDDDEDHHDPLDRDDEDAEDPSFLSSLSEKNSIGPQTDPAAPGDDDVANERRPRARGGDARPGNGALPSHEVTRSSIARVFFFSSDTDSLSGFSTESR